MNSANTCPQCSTAIPHDAPGGVCPRCLIAMGMLPGGTNASTAAAATNKPFIVPNVEELVGKFPNLEIQYLIGQGGMGAVYKARQTNLDRTVALKILSPQLNADPAFAERFTREARTLAKLSHPNIVTVFDFGQADSMHYLVMEYIDGVNLRDTILSSNYTPVEALAIIGQICDALQFAHDEGIVHRDIKPENILVDKNGFVKIADFGLAKLLTPSADEFTLTNTRQVLGTLKYMAPEQIEKPEFVDHRADLYSLGVVFYELLTGELPIGRFAVPSAKAEINNRLDEVVLKTLEKEPDHRYQQASEIKTAVAAAELASGSEQRFEAATFERNSKSTSPDSKSQALPFTTDDVYGGMANGYGIARICEPESLEIEVEVQDCFGAIKLALKTVIVPVSKLSSIQFKSGIFKDTVAIQADSISALSEIPSAKRGLFKMYTTKSDAGIAGQFVSDVQRRLPTAGTSTAFHPVSPTTPTKSNRSTNGSGGSMLGWLVFGVVMFFAAMIGLAIILSSIFLYSSYESESKPEIKAATDNAQAEAAVEIESRLSNRENEAANLAESNSATDAESQNQGWVPIASPKPQVFWRWPLTLIIFAGSGVGIGLVLLSVFFIVRSAHSRKNTARQ